MLPTQVVKGKNEADLTIDLKNGSTIYLMGADSPDSLRGPSPHFVVMEEAAIHGAMVWSEIVRPALTAHQAPALFITTPKGMNWFWELEKEAERLDNWSTFHFTIYDNPFISREEIESAKKECASEIVWRQEYLAEYEAHLGRTIPDYSSDRHFIDLPAYKSEEEIIIPIDWGQRDDTAACFAVIRDQRFCILDFYASNRLGARQQAQTIRRHWEREKFNVERVILSWDAWRVDPDRMGDTVASRFIDEFRPVPVHKSDKMKAARLDLLITMAAQNKLLIHKSPRTQKLNDQLIRLEWKDTLAQDTVGKDDAVDSCGYGAMNIQYLLGLDKKVESDHTNREPEEGKLYLRGYERNEEAPVFDPVTGYIGDSYF